MNLAIVMGRITRDLELKTTVNGTSLCNFTVAVNRRFKNASGNYDADFINCVAWREQADFICKNFCKGKMICIVGELHTQSYEKDAKKLYKTEVYTDRVYFTGDNKTSQDVFSDPFEELKYLSMNEE